MRSSSGSDGVLGELEHAQVEVQPRQLAVEVVGRVAAARRAPPRGCSSSASGGCRWSSSPWIMRRRRSSSGEEIVCASSRSRRPRLLDLVPQRREARELLRALARGSARASASKPAGSRSRLDAIRSSITSQSWISPSTSWSSRARAPAPPRRPRRSRSRPARAGSAAASRRSACRASRVDGVLVERLRDERVELGGAHGDDPPRGGARAAARAASPSIGCAFIARASAGARAGASRLAWRSACCEHGGWPARCSRQSSSTSSSTARRSAPETSPASASSRSSCDVAVAAL